jgi:glycosyltransferase involved in cell wall biosynthesis
MSKISVIIPTYNRAQFIRRAIKSVLLQSFGDYELIVIDDASSDQTQQILEHMNDKRIKIIRHEKNKGAPAARNTGIMASKGEYIGFLDDDDEWLPDKLKEQLKLFETSGNEAGLIYSGFYYVSGRNNRILSNITPIKKGNLYPDLLRRNILGSPTPLVKRNCFDKAGLFDEKLPSCQDWDMWIRISKYYKFDFVPDALSKVYVHGKQISLDLNAKIEAREKLIEKYRNDLTEDPTVLSYHLKRLGVLHCISGNSKKGLKYFISSLKLLPFQRDCYMHILFSIFAFKRYRQFLRVNYTTTLDGVIFYY